MALMASSCASGLGALRQHHMVHMHTVATRCPGTPNGSHTRIQRARAPCSHQEAVMKLPMDGKADQGSKSGMQTWHVHHMHKQLPLRWVALGDNSTHIISCNDGYTICSVGLPQQLRKTLDDALIEANVEVHFAAMGRHTNGKEVWFTKDAQGTSVWAGCNDMLETLISEGYESSDPDERVEKVFFSPNDGWFALKKNGGARWGKLPASLQKDLNKYWEDWDGVSSLSVGHTTASISDGEWFVSFGRGRRYRNINPVLREILDTKHKLTGDVQWVELGPDGSFVALFEKYTLWYGGQSLTDALLKIESRQKVDVVHVRPSLQLPAAHQLLPAVGYILWIFRMLLDIARFLRRI